jgi:GT2 family glycosyltransferase
LFLAESVNYPVQFLAVIVLYKIHPSESAAYRTLLASLASLPQKQNNIRILLYDNTPGGCDPGLLPKDVQYEATGYNAGLSTAYNRALSIAQSEKDAWLLILDQDTTLPTDYLSRIYKIAHIVASDKTIAAVVPRMLDADRQVSPVFSRFWGVSYLPPSFEGTSDREIHATNSATLFRVESLKQVGGFSPYFWLDYVDGYIFHQLFLHGMKIYAAKDISVKHELSLLHSRSLKSDRFQNILRAESAYWDLYGGRVQGLAFTGRLLGRIWRQRKRGHESAIQNLTWNELKRRISLSKARRIHTWIYEMEQRIADFADKGKSQESEDRPRISVCMATYNGEQYITAQLESILNQLRAEDEVIVVDDCSTDRTKDKIRSLRDDRIQLIEHGRNMGVLQAFEDAIRHASGALIFLSDQDDLWAPNKVSAVLRVFQLHGKINIVVSDAALIDESGIPLGFSYYAMRKGFRPGVLANLLHCSYLGCTMAFRSSICSKILPFPIGADIIHDLWIGTMNSLIGGKTVYINHPLVQYRRHEGNVTGNKRLSIRRQIRIRWDLCRFLLASYLSSRNAS